MVVDVLDLRYFASTQHGHRYLEVMVNMVLMMTVLPLHDRDMKMPLLAHGHMYLEVEVMVNMVLLMAVLLWCCNVMVHIL